MTGQELRNIVADIAAENREAAKILKRLEDGSERFQKETEKRFKKLERSDDQHRENIRALRQLGVNIGYSTEEFFFQSFKQEPVMDKVKFDKVNKNARGINNDVEFDIVLVNDIYIGLIEVKHKMRPNDIKKFLKNIPKFKQEFKGYDNYKILAGLASYGFAENSAQIAQKKGLFLFSRLGQSLRVLNDNDFEAKEF